MNYNPYVPQGQPYNQPTNQPQYTQPVPQQIPQTQVQPAYVQNLQQQSAPQFQPAPQFQQPNTYMPPQAQTQFQQPVQPVQQQQQYVPQAQPAQYAPQTYAQPAQAPVPQQYAQQPQPTQYAPQGQPQGHGAQAANAMGAIMAMTQGIGTAALPTDRTPPPLPKNFRRIENAPPEGNMMGDEAISYMLVTNAHSAIARDGRPYAIVKGRVLKTTGDSPPNTEVACGIFAGDYFQPQMKNAVMGILKLTKLQGNDEAFMQQKIREVFEAQAGNNVAVGVKTYVHKSKNNRTMIRWIMFPAQAVTDPATGRVVDFQPANPG
jgi:hypothetical protein